MYIDHYFEMCVTKNVVGHATSTTSSRRFFLFFLDEKLDTNKYRGETSTMMTMKEIESQPFLRKCVSFG
jgi:hypothetical protein